MTVPTTPPPWAQPPAADKPASPPAPDARRRQTTRDRRCPRRPPQCLRASGGGRRHRRRRPAARPGAGADVSRPPPRAADAAGLNPKAARPSAGYTLGHAEQSQGAVMARADLGLPQARHSLVASRRTPPRFAAGDPAPAPAAGPDRLTPRVRSSSPPARSSGSRTDQALRRSRGRRRHLGRRARRDLRHPGAQRGRQDDDPRDDRRAAPPDGGTVEVDGMPVWPSPRTSSGASVCSSRRRRCSTTRGCTRSSTSSGPVRHLPRPRGVRGAARAGRPGRQGRSLRQRAFRGQASGSRCPGARQRPGRDLPRRADDGPRPARPAGALGRDRRDQPRRHRRWC